MRRKYPRRSQIEQSKQPNILIMVAIIGAASTIIAAFLGSPLIEKWLATSPTPTATATPTGTATFTASVLPSLAPPPTFTLTNTVTSTAAPTFTPTITLTPTRTATPTLTSTPTPAYACDTINERPVYGAAIKRGKSFKVGFTIVNTGTSVWPEETELILAANPYGTIDSPIPLKKIPRLQPGATIDIGPYDAKAPDQLGYYVVSFTLGDGSCNPYISFNVVK